MIAEYEKELTSSYQTVKRVHQTDRGFDIHSARCALEVSYVFRRTVSFGTLSRETVMVTATLRLNILFY